jgi:hypothetical protein
MMFKAGFFFPIVYCPPCIQISTHHHVWRADASHKLGVGCDDFLFYLWIATMSSSCFLFLGCGVAGEKNDKLFFLCYLFLQKTHGIRGPICNTFFVLLQIFSWTAGVKVSYSSWQFEWCRCLANGDDGQVGQTWKSCQQRHGRLCWGTLQSQVVFSWWCTPGHIFGCCPCVTETWPLCMRKTPGSGCTQGCTTSKIWFSNHGDTCWANAAWDSFCFGTYQASVGTISWCLSTVCVSHKGLVPCIGIVVWFSIDEMEEVQQMGKAMLGRHFSKPWGGLGTESGPVRCCGFIFDDVHI